MSKRCPKCGQIYSDRTKFCDQDGTTLTDSPSARAAPSAASRSSGGRKAIWGMTAVIVLLVGAVAAYYLCRRHVESGVSVALTGISLPNSPSGKESGTAGKLLEDALGAAHAVFGIGDLMARLNVTNRTGFSGEIVSASYSIYAGERTIGAGSWSNAPGGAAVKFQAGQEVRLSVPFRPDSRSTLAGILELAAGRDSPVTMRGVIQVKTLFFTFGVPFDTPLLGPGGTPLKRTQSF